MPIVAGASNEGQSAVVLFRRFGRYGIIDTVPFSRFITKLSGDCPLRFQAPKGTFDILPEEQPYRRFFESKAEEITESFGYGRIDTPMFEDARLFVRGVGEVTDIIERETYTFEDRGGDLITLRPEGTAPVCRAYLEHGLHNLPQPVRLYYLITNFRYERPQAGRYRQHHQLGHRGVRRRRRDDRRRGDRGRLACPGRHWNRRQDARAEQHRRPGVQARLYREAAGILPAAGGRGLPRLPASHGPEPAAAAGLQAGHRARTVIAGAPHSTEYLCAACLEHWEALSQYLRDLGLPFRTDHRLVRGFDYYTRTVFEIVPPDEGSQSTMVGGGRYDGLIEELGGVPTPGIGFGMGIERAILNVKSQGGGPPDDRGTKVVLAHVGDAAKRRAAGLASQLRLAGTAATLAPGRSLRSQMRYASSQMATHAVILGDDEIERGVVVLRDMDGGEQREVSPDELAAALGG